MMTDKAKENKENQSVEEELPTEDTQRAGDEAEGTAPENSAEEESSTPDALTELQAKYDTLNDKYLRLYSEFDNYRRRTAKEKLDMMKNAGADLLKAFLPVIDDFDRAIASNETDEDLNNVKEGFKLIHHKLMRTMEAQGVKPMDAMEKPFDTEFHEAITNIPAPDASLKGKVVDVAEKGYFYRDDVLRYAKVVVGQ